MLREFLRWSAASLGLFGLINYARAALTGTDDNIWWIDLRWLPSPLASCLIACCCMTLIAGAALPQSRRARIAAATGSLSLSLAAAFNAIVFWTILARGQVSTFIPFPLSAAFSLLLLSAAWAYAQPPRHTTRGRRALATISALTLAALFPLLQTLSFGLTSYARPADAIVVFGARVYADGSPSDALSDRVREGVRLYHAGLAPRLIMSGGPGDGPTSEPQAMQHLAESLGVPREAITEDPRGLNSTATIDTCTRLGHTRVLAASHFYHLPRIKLLAGRAGIAAYTVPSPQGRPLRALPVFVAREVAAWWWYYLKA